MTGTSTWRNRVGLAEMLKGGVIIDVTTADQAKTAEEVGVTAVMAKVRIGHFAEAQVPRPLCCERTHVQVAPQS